MSSWELCSRLWTPYSSVTAPCCVTGGLYLRTLDSTRPLSMLPLRALRMLHRGSRIGRVIRGYIDYSVIFSGTSCPCRIYAVCSHHSFANSQPLLCTTTSTAPGRIWTMTRRWGPSYFFWIWVEGLGQTQIDFHYSMDPHHQIHPHPTVHHKTVIELKPCWKGCLHLTPQCLVGVSMNYHQVGLV